MYRHTHARTLTFTYCCVRAKMVDVPSTRLVDGRHSVTHPPPPTHPTHTHATQTVTDLHVRVQCEAWPNNLYFSAHVQAPYHVIPHMFMCIYSRRTWVCECVCVCLRATCRCTAYIPAPCTYMHLSRPQPNHTTVHNPHRTPQGPTPPHTQSHTTHATRFCLLYLFQIIVAIRAVGSRERFFFFCLLF